MSCFSDCTSKLQTNFEAKNINHFSNELKNVSFQSESPESLASIPSILTFWWANSLILLGYKRPLTKQDIWVLSKENTTKENVRLFDAVKNLKTMNCKIKIGKSNKSEFINSIYGANEASILFTLLKTYRFYLILMAILKLAISFLPYVNLIVLNWIIAYMSNDEPEWRGFFYAGIMFISSLIESLITSQYEVGIATIAMRIRTCLINSIYKKVIKCILMKRCLVKIFISTQK